MSELFDKSIRTLELPRVLQMLADQAVSAEAKTRALAVRPETEPEEVLHLLDQTDAAPPFPVSSRWRRRWTGLTGAAASTPGSC